MHASHTLTQHIHDAYTGNRARSLACLRSSTPSSSSSSSLKFNYSRNSSFSHFSDTSGAARRRRWRQQCRRMRETSFHWTHWIYGVDIASKWIRNGILIEIHLPSQWVSHTWNSHLTHALTGSYIHTKRWKIRYEQSIWYDSCESWLVVIHRISEQRLESRKWFRIFRLFRSF